MYDIEFKRHDLDTTPVIFWDVTHVQFVDTDGSVAEISHAALDDYEFKAAEKGIYRFYSNDGTVGTYDAKDIIVVRKHQLVFNPNYLFTI